MGIVRNILRKFGYFKKDEVEIMIEVILRSTLDKGLVKKAFGEADKFDAGAIDKPLREHLKWINIKLQEADTKIDQKRIENWKEDLGIEE